MPLIAGGFAWQLRQARTVYAGKRKLRMAPPRPRHCKQALADALGSERIFPPSTTNFLYTKAVDVRACSANWNWRPSDRSRHSNGFTGPFQKRSMPTKPIPTFPSTEGIPAARIRATRRTMPPSVPTPPIRTAAPTVLAENIAGHVAPSGPFQIRPLASNGAT